MSSGAPGQNARKMAHFCVTTEIFRVVSYKEMTTKPQTTVSALIEVLGLRPGPFTDSQINQISLSNLVHKHPIGLNTELTKRVERLNNHFGLNNE